MSRDVFAQNQGARLHESDNCAFQTKATHAHDARSVFPSEKSANDHDRRHLKRKTRAKPKDPEASLVPSRRPAPSPAQEERKKRRKKARHAANAFWSVWTRDSGRSRGDTRPGSFRQGHKQSWRPWNRQQTTTKAKIRERTNPIQWVREE